MRTTCSLVIMFILACVATTSAAEPAEKQEWIQLFNGKDLEGWTPKVTGYALGENYGQTFRVANGVLQVRYDQYEKFDRKFGHLIYEEPFSNYVIRVEYRFVGEQAKEGPDWAIRNSGVMVHGQAPETMTKGQEFPVSIEVQLLGGNGTDPRTTANLCTPGTHVVMNGQLLKRHCTSSTSKTYHGDQWVTAEVEVRGNQVIRHKVEGQTVLEYTQPQLDPDDKDAQPLIKDGQVQLSEGYISLQAESHPVEFRKVELRKLTD